LRPPSLAPAILLPALLGLACRAPEPRPAAQPKPAIQVEVTSTPGQAVIFLGGKRIGEAPQALSVASSDELLRMTATREQETVVEKRIRFLGPDQVEVRFVFGADRSVMAKALGLARILVFDYGSAVTFDVDRADLKPEFRLMLGRQAELLKTRFSGTQILVCGHTDAVGGADHNLALSLNRARSVADDLLGQGVAKDQVKIQGFGSTYPVADNGTESGRALNRRTEIILPLTD